MLKKSIEVSSENIVLNESDIEQNENCQSIDIRIYKFLILKKERLMDPERASSFVICIIILFIIQYEQFFKTCVNIE